MNGRKLPARRYLPAPTMLLSSAVLVVWMLYCGPAAHADYPPRSEDGILDLTGWDFQRDGTIGLSGDWKLAWQEFLDPAGGEAFLPGRAADVEQPGLWNNQRVKGKILGGRGYATLALRLKLPPRSVGQKLGFKISYMYTAYRLWVDGQLIAENGVPGTTAETSRPQYLPQVVFFTPRGTSADIVVHVSNFAHRKGGMPEPLLLGTDRQVLNRRERSILTEMIIVGALLIMGLYHFTIYLMRRQEKSALLFSLYCFGISFRELLMGERLLYFFLPWFPWTIGQKLDYLTIYLTFPVFVYFLRTLFPFDMDRWIPRANAILSACFGLLVIVTPAAFFTNSLKYFQIVILITGAACLYVLVRASLRRREGALIILLGTMLFFITAINDTLYNNSFIRTTYLSTVGLLVFTITQTILLSYLFTRAYSLIENINSSLWRFVPREFLRLLGKRNIVEVKLGDQVDEDLTVLFADIRGFTQISEKMSPVDNFNFINAYLEIMGPVIREHGGFIDKYIGDAIMALFPGDPTRAVRAAIHMQSSLEDFNAELRKRGFPPVTIGISLNRGKLMLGIVGEKERMESTVISDAVNVASRMEGLNKRFGTGIIISRPVFQAIRGGDFLTRFLGNVQVRGREGSIEVFEVLNADPENVRIRKAAARLVFEDAVGLQEQGKIREALAVFIRILRENPEDTPARYYIHQLSRRAGLTAALTRQTDEKV